MKCGRRARDIGPSWVCVLSEMCTFILESLHMLKLKVHRGRLDTHHLGLLLVHLLLLS